MASSSKLLRGILMLVCWLGIAGIVEPSSAETEKTAFNVPVQRVADYLYAMIETDREVYTKHVVASENWKEKHTLPLPAQFLKESGHVMTRKGLGIEYRLISLWPINKRNYGSSNFEKSGLGFVLNHPTKPHTAFVTEGGKSYFRAVYPDRAVAQACIGCHNSHPDSPKRDFKINDVMGGIVISILLK